MKVLGVKQFHQKTFKFLDLEDSPMKGILGNLPKWFVMVVKGASGNGKTEFMVQLCKELCNHGRLAYLSYEQGHGADFQMATMRNDMEEYNGQFFPVDPWEDVKPGTSMLEDLIQQYCATNAKGKTKPKRSAPDFLVIDSGDDSGFSYEDYKRLKMIFKNRTSLIWVVRSHKNGRIIKKAMDDIAFDGQATILVKDYIAYPEKSRLGGIEPYVIWDAKAKERNPVFFAKRDMLQEPKKQKKKPTKKKP